MEFSFDADRQNTLSESLLPPVAPLTGISSFPRPGDRCFQPERWYFQPTYDAAPYLRSVYPERPGAELLPPPVVPPIPSKMPLCIKDRRVSRRVSESNLKAPPKLFQYKPRLSNYYKKPLSPFMYTKDDKKVIFRTTLDGGIDNLPEDVPSRGNISLTRDLQIAHQEGYPIIDRRVDHYTSFPILPTQTLEPGYLDMSDVPIEDKWMIPPYRAGPPVMRRGAEFKDRRPEFRHSFVDNPYGRVPVRRDRTAAGNIASQKLPRLGGLLSSSEPDIFARRYAHLKALPPPPPRPAQPKHKYVVELEVFKQQLAEAEAKLLVEKATEEELRAEINAENAALQTATANARAVAVDVESRQVFLAELDTKIAELAEAVQKQKMRVQYLHNMKNPTPEFLAEREAVMKMVEEEKAKCFRLFTYCGELSKQVDELDMRIYELENTDKVIDAKKKLDELNSYEEKINVEYKCAEDLLAEVDNDRAVVDRLVEQLNAERVSTVDKKRNLECVLSEKARLQNRIDEMILQLDYYMQRANKPGGMLADPFASKEKPKGDRPGIQHLSVSPFKPIARSTPKQGNTSFFKLVDEKERILSQFNHMKEQKDLLNNTLNRITQENEELKRQGNLETQVSGSPRRQASPQRQVSGSPQRQASPQRQVSGSPRRQVSPQRQVSGSPRRQVSPQRQATISPEGQGLVIQERQATISPERQGIVIQERQGTISPDGQVVITHERQETISPERQTRGSPKNLSQ